jgi:7,8-dihydropterin-6-yl-methyl-4-(beta-D-ribofuranosyl)aminobenzene 5'-phosphate synthase
MKITTLIENLVYQPGLVSEHGLSFYIDSGRRRILFDTGQSDAFINNAKQLGIDLTNVDAVVISHGHYDHTGGLVAFLKENSNAPVYMKKAVFQKKYNNNNSFIGTAKLPAEYDNRIVWVEDVIEIDEGIFIVPHIPVKYEEDTSFRYFYTDKGKGMETDHFDDELFLTIVNENKLSVLSSCSHRGISNIVEEARRLFQLPVHLVTGGFHLKNAPQEQYLAVVDYLRELKPENIGICHCTGIENFSGIAKEAVGRVFYNFTGHIEKI